ncbi:MAG: endo-1,4-beta-xylanase, partial [Bacteroidales bacterium]
MISQAVLPVRTRASSVFFFLPLSWEGAPLTAVGLQGHFNIDIPVTWSRLTEQVQRYRALGLKVYVTEMDAQQYDNSTAWDATIANRQGEYFYQYVKAALEGDANGIFVWGVRDNQDPGWLFGENPVLFDESGAPKPAYYGVQRAFQEAASTGGTGGSGGTGGALNTGGDTAAGGAVAAGGDTATGGVEAMGGSVATGGATGTGGGVATGGSVASGGDQSAGGTSAVGG